MASSKSYHEIDEPLTPLGRQFVQPQMGPIIYTILTCELPLDVGAIRTLLECSRFLTYPRLTSLLVKKPSGREVWHKTKVNINDHLIIHHLPISKTPDDDINEYVSSLCSMPLSTEKPLWELHLLLSHNTMIFSIHHAIGDGISIMSLLMSICRREDNPMQQPSVGMVRRRMVIERWWWTPVWLFFKMIWYALVYLVMFLLTVLSLRKDGVSVVHSGDEVKLGRRKVVTARFSMEDMKFVKGVVPGATINDVLFGVVSRGLSRYIEMRSSPGTVHDVLLEGLRITCLEMVNLRQEGGLQEMPKLMEKNSTTPWGNKFTYLLVPISYHQRSQDPIQSVRRAKALMINRRLPLKNLFFSKIVSFATSLLGRLKLLTISIHRLLCNTSFTISNIVGPGEKISIAGNIVRSYKITVSDVPHALVMHFLSYANVADMQIMVLSDVISEPKELAKCFEDAMMEMKEAATTVEVPVKSRASV